MITVDKYSGRVTQINTRYTVLQGLDGVESIVPNEMLVSGAVQNSSLSNSLLNISTKVSVAYDTDVDHVIQLLNDAALTVEEMLRFDGPVQRTGRMTMADVEIGGVRPQIRPRVSGYVRSAKRPWSGSGSRRYDINGKFDRMG